MIKAMKKAFSLYRGKWVIFIALAAAFSLILSGCGVVKGEFFGIEFGGVQEEDSPADDLEDATAGCTEDTIVEEQAYQDEASSDESIIEQAPPEEDLEEMRYYFTEAMDQFDDQAYIIAEYYLLKIKDNYLILQDHIFYYLAKSFLMQKKYDEAEDYYSRILENFPDSIWAEVSAIEIADLYYLREDYAAAGEKYNEFDSLYPGSDYSSYSLYQQAVCLEKSSQPLEAFDYYRKIWLEQPASDYADQAYADIKRLEDEETVADFSPSLEELYQRAQSLFDAYRYQESADQLLDIINENPRSSFTGQLYADSCFRLGMDYYNMAEYSQARDWLLECYEDEPDSSIAHAALFFIGRAYTNLDSNTKAVTYYNKLLSEYPSSSYGDDALYRMGRIYSIDNQTSKAVESFGRVPEEYPYGDKTDEALWEMGWIQYKSGDWNDAKESFSDMASLYKNTALGEKALYWQAKCHVNLGESEQALELCRQIVDLNNYSYYTFTARDLADSLDSPITIEGINTSLSVDSDEARELLPGVLNDIDRDVANIDGKVDHVTKSLELIKLGFYDSAALEISSGDDTLKEDPERALGIATLYYNAQDYFNSLAIIYHNYSNIKESLSSGHLSYAYYLYYPYAYGDIIDKYCYEYGVDPLFALAVIRQESNFKADAGSYVGARGLMQIMPSTGEGIAGQIGLEDYNDSMLIDPEVNIRMGIYYLDQQLDNFNGNQVYCLGAYNGGPGSMSSWISRFGDKSQDEFIENITYLETKDYIKKVMGYYYFYQMLYP